MQTRFRVSDGLFFFFVLDGKLGDLFADDVNHAAVHHALGLANCAENRARVGIAVRLDDRAFHTQQRRAADFGGIKAAFNVAKRILRQQRGQLALGGIPQAALNQAENQRKTA